MTGPTLVILGAGRARRYGGVKQLAPIGVHDEAVIDLIASDAYSSGFERIVIVINPDTGPQIREHVAANWPSHAPVDFAIQEVPLGTVHAVLAAREHVGADTPFGVANADDLYGLSAMAALGSHLRHEGTNCLVGFRLDRALVGELPVTRGICDVHKGRLTGIIERRQVHLEDGDFFCEDGLAPHKLEPDTRVSMNLWGFSPQMWEFFQEQMDEADAESDDYEVLLPEVVGTAIAHDIATFTVLLAESQCVGVTYKDDLDIVKANVAAQVARGERPERAFAF